MNYVGFATWVGATIVPNLFPAVHRPGCLLPALSTMEASRMGAAHQGEVCFDPPFSITLLPGQPYISNHLHHLLNPRHSCTNDGFPQRDR